MKQNELRGWELALMAGGYVAVVLYLFFGAVARGADRPIDPVVAAAWGWTAPAKPSPPVAPTVTWKTEIWRYPDGRLVAVQVRVEMAAVEVVAPRPFPDGNPLGSTPHIPAHLAGAPSSSLMVPDPFQVRTPIGADSMERSGGIVEPCPPGRP